MLPGDASWSRTAPASSAASIPSSAGSGSHAIGTSSSRIAEDRRRIADQREDCLAAEAHVPVREHRLVLARRVDAEQVVAGHVGRGEHADQARMALVERRQVADREPRMVVRRADGTEQQDAGVVEVVAEALGAGHLLDAVRAGDPGADRLAHGRVRRGGERPGGCATDRLEDRRVAGASAQHAAEAVAHVGVGRGGGPRDEVVGRHQHPRRARPALRAAAREEGGLERGEAVARAQALDRLDAPALRLAGRDEARAHLVAVDPHRARAAVAGVAADLGPREPEVLAQDVDQATAPVRLDLDRAAVDLEPHARRRRVGDHATTSASARRTSVRTASER